MRREKQLHKPTAPPWMVETIAALVPSQGATRPALTPLARAKGIDADRLGDALSKLHRAGRLTYDRTIWRIP